MYPIIDLGIFKLPSYALMIVLGGILYTIIVICIFEKKEKIEQEITNRILVISIFGFIILGVTAFVMNSIFHSIEKGKIHLGGITWLGGVLWAFPIMVVLIHKFCPKVKGKALDIFNLLIPGIVVAHGFGRIGCFLGGCCYGMVTNNFLGVSFPAGSAAAKVYPASDGSSLAVLPTQLYEALFEFLLFAIMILSYNKLKRHFLEVYAFSYGTFRFLLEFVRGDDRGVTLAFLTPSQIMSIILISIGILIVLYHKRIVFNKIHDKMDRYISAQSNKSYNTNDSVIEIIRGLKMLLDEGAITAEEFQNKKEELLKRL